MVCTWCSKLLLLFFNLKHFCFSSAPRISSIWPGSSHSNLYLASRVRLGRGRYFLGVSTVDYLMMPWFGNWKAPLPWTRGFGTQRRSQTLALASSLILLPMVPSLVFRKQKDQGSKGKSLLASWGPSVCGHNNTLDMVVQRMR